MMQTIMQPIGVVRTEAKALPRHCRMSSVEGELIIEDQYFDGLTDIEPGEKMVVLFCFHKSPAFTPEMLRLMPPHRNRELGVFSTCSPRRPNPIGMSVVEVVAVEECCLRVKGLDMFDGTPILDLKPFRDFER